MLKIPESMYGKGPKNNPSPGKSWDTSGSKAYGDSELRNLREAPKPNIYTKKQFFVDLIDLRKGKEK